MKPFTTFAAVVFAAVAIGHLARLLFGVEVLVNGIAIPLWISGVGTVIPAILSFMLWREARTPGGTDR